MVKIIGLAGNIGSGKSLVAAILQELGAAIIDADALSRLIVEPGRPAYEDIIAAFGREYLAEDGNIDRKKLGRLIFSDATARARLNAITHPRIGEEAASLIDKYKDAGYGIIVLEAALLLESGSFHGFLDECWLVTAPRQQICRRLAQRDSLTLEQAATRLDAQMAPEQQALLADCVIVNDGDVEQLRQKITLLYKEIIDTSK